MLKKNIKVFMYQFSDFIVIIVNVKKKFFVL